jgi:hypothetical protein
VEPATGLGKLSLVRLNEFSVGVRVLCDFLDREARVPLPQSLVESIQQSFSKWGWGNAPAIRFWRGERADKAQHREMGGQTPLQEKTQCPLPPYCSHARTSGWLWFLCPSVASRLNSLASRRKREQFQTIRLAFLSSTLRPNQRVNILAGRS